MSDDMVTVKIYLNDGEDHFFGFKNDFANNPELTMVHSFEVDAFLFAGHVKYDAISNIREWVYTELNVGVTSELAREYRAKMLRSLSVGDVIVIGETAFACGSYGWDTITTEELNNAIIWDDDKESV
jgi:hypothetical protein